MKLLSYTIACCLLLSGASFAAAPPETNLQIALTDPNGAPLSAAVDVRIDLFRDPNGGDALFSEMHLNVPADRGILSVRVGRGSIQVGSFDPTLFAGVGLFAEFTLDGQRLEPRMPVRSVPWALRAENVATAQDAATFGGTAPAGLQRRIYQTCSEGSSIESIGADGSVVCVADDGDQSDVTSLTAGSGLTGGGVVDDVTIGVDTDAVQGRIASGCPPGQAIQAIANDGSVTCLEEMDAGGTLEDIQGPSGVTVFSSGGTYTLSTVAVNPVKLANGSVGSSELAAVDREHLGPDSIRHSELKTVTAVRYDCNGTCSGLSTSFQEVCDWLGPNKTPISLSCNDPEEFALGFPLVRELNQTLIGVCEGTGGVDGIVYCLDD